MKDLVDKSQLTGSRRQAPNLKKLLTRATFSTQKVAEVQKCGDPRCGTCEMVEAGQNKTLKSGTVIKTNRRTYTIFAPTNATFDALGTEHKLLSDKTVLTTILLYHVTNGVIRRSDARNELTVESVAGLTVRFNIYFNKLLEYHLVPHTEYSLGLYNREHLRTLDKKSDTISLSVSGGNLIEVLQANSESSLIKYATACGLADTILGGTFTIFAPTNAAFDAIGTEQELLSDKTVLTTILLYHLTNGVIRSTDARNELTVESVAGLKIRFNVYQHNKAVTVEGAKISKFDLNASNGIVHVIDKVMIPPTGGIVDLVTGNKDLSTLLSLVQKSNIIGIIERDPLTVFAPTNAAFSRLPANVLSRLNSDTALLKEVLEYHLVPHTEYSPGLYNREYLRTLDSQRDVIRLSVSGGNLVEVLQANGASRLIQYATACGLADTILGGTYTIFAPTNAAFDALGTEQELLSDKTVLTTILLYHLTNGVIRRSDAQNELTVESVAGLKVRFNIYKHNNAVTVEGAKISKFFYDLDASNGIVHIIDKVLIPPTGGIADLVSGNKELSTLLSLFQKAKIAGIIQSDPLTLFAPTNAAFSRLSANVSSRLNSDTQLLIEVLEYHLVPHTEYSSGLYNREFLGTLAVRDYIRLNMSETGVSVNSYAHVIKADIPATNGVVHVIDHVLIPHKHMPSFGFGK
ncbi:TGFBI [Mytilus coruscus]|uniref:TGFBI n=1 Tax=Mytilus coruscus TaxID=42192 RepID=A0A6J8DCV1_MYTCO|nr:TGFBI [Mytilus coruscus]